jgi:hypothetical protein
MAASDGKIVLIALLSAGVPVFLLAPATAEAAASHAMAFAVKLEASELQARISDREPGTVRFQGRAAVDALPVCRARVELRAYLDIGWKLDIAPSTMVFTSMAPQDFTVTILVPQGTPADMSGNLTVVGRCSLGGFEYLAGTRGTITVAPYCGARLVTGKPVLVTSPGEGSEVDLGVLNTGNAEGSYELEITNLGNLRTNRWELSFSCTTATAPAPARMGAVRLHTRFGAGALDEFEGLWFAEAAVVSSSGSSSGRLVLDEISLALYVKPGPAAYLCPSFIILLFGVEMALTVKLVRDWNRHRLRKAAMEKVDGYGE